MCRDCIRECMRCKAKFCNRKTCSRRHKTEKKVYCHICQSSFGRGEDDFFEDIEDDPLIKIPDDNHELASKYIVAAERIFVVATNEVYDDRNALLSSGGYANLPVVRNDENNIV